VYEEDQTQNYDPKIHAEYMYLIHDLSLISPIPVPHHL